jgi:hypothetical protein
MKAKKSSKDKSRHPNFRKRLAHPPKGPPIKGGSVQLVLEEREEDWLDVLKRCPVPMDDIPPRSRELPKKLNLDL